MIATTDPVATVLQRLREHNCATKRAGNGWAATCPAHDDASPSLSVGTGADGRALLTCHAGCPTQDVCAALGLEMRDLMPADNGTTNGNGTREPKAQPKPPPPPKAEAPRKIVATYEYTDAQGELLFEVARFAPKDFRQRRPDRRGGWIWNLQGVQRVPYRLREIVDADPDEYVIIVEGEKDADHLSEAGFVATTAPQGAGKWGKVDDSALEGRRVAIVPDDDEPGMKHAEDVAQRLHGRAAEVRIVELPHGKDASDFFDAGGTAEELRELIENAEPVTFAEVDVDAADAEGDADDDDEPELRWEPFPTHLLPKSVARFVRESAGAIGVDEGFAGPLALPVMAAATGTARVAKVKHDHHEHPVLWAMLVAPSGAIKSPSFDACVRPLREIEPLQQQYQRDLLKYQKSLARWRKQGGDDDPPEEPVEPAEPRYILQDTTAEAMARIMQHNGKLLCACDEAAGWVAGFDRYRAREAGGDMQRWLELHRAGALLVDRRTADTIRVHRAAASVCGTVQPSVARRILTPDKIECGFAARLLLVRPPVRPEVWTDRDVSRDAREAYATTIRSLVELEPVFDGDETRPVALTLSGAARDVYRAWVAETSARLAELHEDDALRAAISKLKGGAVRFGLIFELVENPDATEISADTLKRGCELARWFIHEQRRVYRDLIAPADARQADTLPARVLRLVEERGEITGRELQQAKLAKTSAEAAEILNALVSAGTLEREYRQGERGRGTTVYRSTLSTE